MAIRIANKLEVLTGNKILVPGCEPTSAFTSPTLAENRDCTASIVDLADALAAIPGSTVIYIRNPRKKFFVLPNGPAEDPSVCDNPCVKSVQDWYQILRNLGDQVDVPKLNTGRCGDRPLTVGEICEAFPLKGIF